MTSSELKYHVESVEPYFFTRQTMKFFGDTMKNYGVRGPVEIDTPSGPATVYELYRRRPVKHGLQKSAYFDVTTFKRRFKTI
jgi:hypothetical protein